MTCFRFGEVLGPDNDNNRSKVSVIMEFRNGDKKTLAEIMPSLRHYTNDNTFNEFTFHLSVIDHVLFKICMICDSNVFIWKGAPNFNEQKFKRRKVQTTICIHLTVT